MRNLVFCLLFSSILFSCDDSDDSTLAPDDLNGTWELQSVSCFCFFADDFDFSGHKIDFDNAEGALTIENSPEAFFITEAGRYDFEVQNSKIVIKDVAEYNFGITGDTLVMSSIDDPEISDAGITLTYEKAN